MSWGDVLVWPNCQVENSRLIFNEREYSVKDLLCRHVGYMMMILWRWNRICFACVGVESTVIWDMCEGDCEDEFLRIHCDWHYSWRVQYFWCPTAKYY